MVVDWFVFNGGTISPSCVYLFTSIVHTWQNLHATKFPQIITAGI